MQRKCTTYPEDSKTRRKMIQPLELQINVPLGGFFGTFGKKEHSIPEGLEKISVKRGDKGLGVFALEEVPEGEMVSWSKVMWGVGRTWRASPSVDFSHVPMPRHAKAKQGSDHCQSICRWKAGAISMFFLKTRDRTNTLIVWNPCGPPFNLSDPLMRSMPVMLLLIDLARDSILSWLLGWNSCKPMHRPQESLPMFFKFYSKILAKHNWVTRHTVPRLQFHQFK